MEMAGVEVMRRTSGMRPFSWRCARKGARRATSEDTTAAAIHKGKVTPIETPDTAPIRLAVWPPTGGHVGASLEAATHGA